MGCITGKPSAPNNHKHEVEDIRRRSSLHVAEAVVENVEIKRKKSTDSQDLAYQFIQMMAKQQEIEENDNKEQKEIGFHSCPRLSLPSQSSLIRKRLRRIPGQCTATTLHY